MMIFLEAELSLKIIQFCNQVNGKKAACHLSHLRNAQGDGAVAPSLRNKAL